ncbi:hypothetical protein AB0D66_22615 [Streptomyces sp. NPDC048270]|uniref:hypothetical protein n=1 Tax=Streptomyces sp. NPDC048270 TaxID=3154615 RepID=UPI0033E16EC7
MNLPVPLPSEPHRSEAYADWVRAHDPGAGAAAAGLLADVRERVSRAYPKAGRALDGMAHLSRGLPPAHLPWFWDTMAHRLASWAPKAAGRAYTLARAAEREHTLPVDPAWRRGNVLLLARSGALPAKELRGHQAWLAAELDPADAHAEYVRVLTAWAASPGEPPADLARRVRASARAAGLGPAEEARVLAALIGAARGKAVPDTLLDAAAALLADHPQDDGANARLLEVFPESRNDAAAWLRLLLRSGAADAAAAGRITPEGGPAAWLGRYTRAYSHRKEPYGGVSRQPTPPELLDLAARFAPLLRAAGQPVRLHEDRYHRPGLDADLLDLCLAERIAVEDPGETVRLHFWGARSRRDLKALAADPVFGPRLEGTVHAGLRGAGTAITRLPANPGIAAEVHTRIESLAGALAGGGLAAADEAVGELRDLLDRPTATALDGIEEVLAALDLTGPLARTLRAGLPEELGWPALDAALAGFAPGELAGVTCTWPVLTLYGRGHAVAVDPSGVRAAHGLRLPEESAHHTVHFAGGQFLVGWTTDPESPFATHAHWTGSPDEVFRPEHARGLRPYLNSIQGGLGYQFESADGRGRHDGEGVLRPGGREGIRHHDQQMGDGAGIWSSEVFASGDDWARVDPVTGVRAAGPTLPEWHRTAEVPPGTALFRDQLTLAALPEGAPASPLGQDGRLTGCRVLYRTPYAGPSPTDFLLEGIDGRRARYRSRRPGRRPWGIVRMPQGGEDAVLAGEAAIRCHAAEDGSLLWEVHGLHGPDRSSRDRPSSHSAGPVPPPAYWHFLATRDEPSSKALRAIGDGAVRALLDAGGEAGVRAVIARALPEVTEPRVVAGVVRAALLAADVRRRREELSRRVGIMRSGPVVRLAAAVADTALAPALGGLLPEVRPYSAYVPGPHPATLTALAADGRHLRGEIDDETRRLAPPAAPAEWAALLGGIDAVAWRAAVATTAEADRAALAALLETWSGQPYAEPDSRWRTGRSPEAALARCRAAGSPVASGPERGGLARFVQPAAGASPQAEPASGAGRAPGAGPSPRPGRTRGAGPGSGAGPVSGSDAPPGTALAAGAAPSAGAGEAGFEVVVIARDDAARLPRLLRLVAERGPLAPPAEALDLFSRRTGVRRAIAALVLGGLPRRADHDEHLKLLRAAPYRADQAMARQYDDFCHRLGDAGRRAVLAAGMPEDPAGLWEEGAVSAAAERMAAAWAERLGTTPYVDEELASALEADLGLGDGWARVLAAGGAEAGVAEDGGAAAGGAEDREGAAAAGTPDGAGYVLVGNRSGGLDLHHAGPDGSAGRRVGPAGPFPAEPASVVAWALTERPVGDPATRAAAALYGTLRARLDDPRTLIPLCWNAALGRAAVHDPAFLPYAGSVLPCPEPPYREGTEPSAAYDDGLFVVASPGREVYLRPAALADPQRVERAVRLCGELGLPGVLEAVRRIEAVCGGGLARMVARAASTPVPPGGYELNPASSVPELVAEVARTLGVGADAAALHLQLLALARPTDRGVRRWNGWTPARHKAAQAELAAAGAVHTGKRARAGRTAFAPGPWAEFKAPHPPLEAAKLPAHGVSADTSEFQGPFIRLLPPVPAHELFASAWARAGGG